MTHPNPAAAMYLLRDSMFTYEVSQAAHVRRPRMSPFRLDQRWTTELARSLCRDPGNRRVITELVDAELGRRLDDRVVPERFAQLVSSGRLTLREVETPDAYPLPDPYAEPPMALAELTDEVADERPRSWISLELVHSAGVATENLEVEVKTADGRELYGRLDAEGRWSTEDIDPGSCSIRLLEHPALQKQRRPRKPTVSVEKEDIEWVAGTSQLLDLRTAEHHRIVITQPRIEYCLSA